MYRSALVSGCLILAVLLAGPPANPAAHGQIKPLPVPKDLASYKDVVQHVLPAVVSIETQVKPVTRATGVKPEQGQPFDEPRIPEEFRKFFGDFGQQPFQLPEQVPQHAFGSGFLVSADGVVLTNNHVVQGADEVTVQLQDGRKFTSKEIKTDPKTDLAIVRIHAKGSLPYLELGDSDKAAIGDRVLAVGAPFGLAGTVTHGIISAKGRNLHMNTYEDFLQTDAPINPGNSGGPLVNLEGQVIGINSAIKSQSGGWQGIGMAIASNLAKNVMEQLEKYGVVHRGYLGVEIRSLDPEVAKRLGVPDNEGVVVSRVVEGSPAAKAGIHAGDVITALDGKRVTSGRELQQAVAALAAKKTADVTVFRDGKTEKLPVTVAEQPATFGTAANTPEPPPAEEKHAVTLEKFGLELSDLTRETRAQYGYKEKATGALVDRVTPDGPAARAGLERGMLITRVEQTPVKSAAEARDALQKGSLDKGVLLQVRSPRGGTDYVMLTAKAAD
jgi:serine protease Do